MVAVCDDDADCPGLWPGTGTRVTSPAAVSAKLAPNGPNGTGDRSIAVGSNQPFFRLAVASALTTGTPLAVVGCTTRSVDSRLRRA